MSTIKQIAANRLNALKSTGPRSVEGKAIVSMNALKTGIDAKSHVIRGESPEALDASPMYALPFPLCHSPSPHQPISADKFH